jgi:hypothetical protein
MLDAGGLREADCGLRIEEISKSAIHNLQSAIKMSQSFVI